MSVMFASQFGNEKLPRATSIASALMSMLAHFEGAGHGGEGAGKTHVTPLTVLIISIFSKSP